MAYSKCSGRGRDGVFPERLASKLEHLKEDVLSAFENELSDALAEFRIEYDAVQQDNEALRKQLEVFAGEHQKTKGAEYLLPKAPPRNHAAYFDLTVKVEQEQEAPARSCREIVTEGMHLALADEPHEEASPDPPAARTSGIMKRINSIRSTGSDCLTEKPNKKQVRPTRREMDEVARRRCLFFEQSGTFRVWSMQLVVFMALSIWADSVAYCQQWNEEETGPFGLVWEWMVWALFTVDVLVNFNLAYENNRGWLVTSRKAIAIHYIKTFFIIDFISAMPLQIFSHVQSKDRAQEARLLKTLKVFKAFRIAKVLKFLLNAQQSGWFRDQIDDLLFWAFRDLPVSELFGYCGRVTTAVTQLLTVVLCEAHFVACVVIAQERNTLTWEYNGTKSVDLNPWFKYGVAFWWSTQSLVTGYVDEVALKFTTPLIEPRWLHVAVTLASLANIVIAISLFANTKGSDDSSFDFRLRRLGFFLRGQPRVSPFMARMAISYHRLQQRVTGLEDVQDLLDELPLEMKKGLISSIYEPAMENFRLFYQGPFYTSDYTVQICSLMRPMHHLANQMVLTTGTVLEGMYFTLSGDLLITHDIIAPAEPHQGRSLGGSVRSSIKGLAAEVDRLVPIDLGQQEDIPEGEELESAGRVFGIEALFAPDMNPWKLAQHSILTDTMCTVAVLHRKEFDKVVVQHKELAHFVQSIRTGVGEDRIKTEDLCTGLPEDTLRQFHHQFVGKTESKVTSEDLGVSGRYLTELFQPDLAKCGFQNFSGTSFSNLGDHFWGEHGDFCGFEGSQQHVCPRDGMTGSAIVDALDDGNHGGATHFVSWCWRYTVETVVSALSVWMEDHHLTPTAVFFWMCFFCNNQRKMLIQKEGGSLLSTFGDRLAKIGHMIILLDTYQGPYYTKRVWCIYETFVATSSGVIVDVAIPSAIKKVFGKTLQKGGFSDIAASLTDIDCESAEATQQSDCDMIKGLVKKTIGFTAVNEQVKCALIKWLASAFGEYLKQYSTSEVSRHIYQMIAGSMDAPCFRLPQWLQAIREHPQLFQYLNLDELLPEKSFIMICPKAEDQDEEEEEEAAGTTKSITGHISRARSSFHHALSRHQHALDGVTVQDLEQYLHKIEKNNINGFAAWLRTTQGDDAVATLRDDLKTELFDKLEDLQLQIKSADSALKELTFSDGGDVEYKSVHSAAGSRNDYPMIMAGVNTESFSL